MQNKHPQRRFPPLQYLQDPDSLRLSLKPQKSSIIDQEVATFLWNAKFEKCARRFTTRLNTLENRIDALETMLLHGRPETCTVDTMTARRLGGLRMRKRRRSGRVVSVSASSESMREEHILSDDSIDNAEVYNNTAHPEDSRKAYLSKRLRPTIDTIGAARRNLNSGQGSITKAPKRNTSSSPSNLDNTLDQVFSETLRIADSPMTRQVPPRGSRLATSPDQLPYASTTASPTSFYDSDREHSHSHPPATSTVTKFQKLKQTRKATPLLHEPHMQQIQTQTQHQQHQQANIRTTSSTTATTTTNTFSPPTSHHSSLSSQISYSYPTTISNPKLTSQQH